MGFPGARGFYISSAAYNAVTQWAASTAVAAGDIRRQLATPTAGQERVFVCLTGGTTDATEPTWTITRGGITTETSGVVWQECTGQPAVNGDLTNTPDWSYCNAQAITLGHIIKDVAGTHIFICSTAGTAGGTEPTWDTAAVGNTTADNTVTWTYLGTSFTGWGAADYRIWHAYQSNWGDNVALPGINGQNVFPGGQFFFVADNHNEQATGSTNAPPSRGTLAVPVRLLSVDHLGSIPPVSADLLVGATVTGVGTGLWTGGGGGYHYAYGLTWQPDATSGNNGCSINPFGVYEKCAFGTNGSGTCSQPGNSSHQEWIDCSFNFGNTGGKVYFYGRTVWRDTATPFTGSLPSQFIGTNNNVSILLDGVDLSGFGANHFITDGSTGAMQDITLRNCKLSAGFVLHYNDPGENCRYRMINCDSGNNWPRSEVHDVMGDMTTDTAEYRAAGASQNSTSFSWQISTRTNLSFATPFVTLPMSVFNPTTAANVTVTLYGAANTPSMPTNGDIWAEIGYQADNTTPISSRKTSRQADFLPSTAGTSLTADTSDWSGVASARANSTAYSLGQTIQLASNSGRLFVCTTAGTSDTAEPAGYATAVDGDSVTDGTAVFRAVWRFKIVITLTTPQPAVPGIVYGLVKVALASTTVWIDPVLNLA